MAALLDGNKRLLSASPTPKPIALSHKPSSNSQQWKQVFAHHYLDLKHRLQRWPQASGRGSVADQVNGPGEALVAQRQSRFKYFCLSASGYSESHTRVCVCAMAGLAQNVWGLRKSVTSVISVIFTSIYLIYIDLICYTFRVKNVTSLHFVCVTKPDSQP